MRQISTSHLDFEDEPGSIGIHLLLLFSAHNFTLDTCHSYCIYSYYPLQSIKNAG